MLVPGFATTSLPSTVKVTKPGFFGGGLGGGPDGAGTAVFCSGAFGLSSFFGGSGGGVLIDAEPCSPPCPASPQGFAGPSTLSPAGRSTARCAPAPRRPCP